MKLRGRKIPASAIPLWGEVGLIAWEARLAPRRGVRQMAVCRGRERRSLRYSWRLETVWLQFRHVPGAHFYQRLRGTTDR